MISIVSLEKCPNVNLLLMLLIFASVGKLVEGTAFEVI
jgi:hypothetical protein